MVTSATTFNCKEKEKKILNNNLNLQFKPFIYIKIHKCKIVLSCLYYSVL